jgi:tetratricopeptide (TPR) repeat protein
MRAPLVVLALAVTVGTAAAQPAGDTKPDFAKAAALYKAAEAAMAAGSYGDAARDYAEAYDITKDPVLFFKIGGAHDKAGRCDVALTYYRRYLSEGTPAADFKKLTEERVVACEALVAKPVPEPGPSPEPARDPDGDPAKPPPEDSTAQLSERPSLVGSRPSRTRGVAWITLGVGIAFGTLGTVSALSAEAAEKDLADLYGSQVPYIEATRATEQKIIDQGKRYETLAWVGFAAAGASFVAATILFVASADDGEEAPPVSVHVGDGGASVVGSWTF